MKRIANLKINIGLNNNPLNSTQLANKFYESDLFSNSKSKQVTSTYNNEPEGTFVIQGITNYKLSNIIDKVEGLCIVLHQECIAVIYNSNELLIYAPNTKIAKEDQLKFDINVFKS